MFRRLVSAASLTAFVALAGLAAPAQAGVSWSIGIDAPLAPGVHVGTVIGGGAAPRYYAPAPVYAPPPPVYVAPPVYAPAPVVYAPRPVYYAPRPVVYRAPVLLRPHGHVHWHPAHRPHHPYQPQGHAGRGGHGHGYGPMAQVHGGVR